MSRVPISLACSFPHQSRRVGESAIISKSTCGAQVAQQNISDCHNTTMADDGMLMNLSIGDGILGAKTVFKGGRWRDRLTAKKRARYHGQKIQTSEPFTGSNAVPAVVKDPETNGTHPAKRQKLDGSTISRPKHDPNKPTAEVVSSLFSSNPSTTAPHPEGNPSDNVPPPTPSNAPLSSDLDTFTSLGISPTLATHLLTKLSLKAPTAIQKSTITQLLKEDSDAFIQAETGSGKTLAYLLPIVQRILLLSQKPTPTSEASAEKDAQHRVHRDSGLFAIILAPTRELCKQISLVLSALLGAAHWIVAGTVIGGEKKKSEKARLRKGLNILVATPGRLADHLDNTEVLDVSNVRWLVLDEGDRLMELGFEEEIRGIVRKLEKRSWGGKAGIPGLPERRTTVMCSATMKMTVQRLGEISLKDAVHIQAEPQDSPNPGDRDRAGSKETAFLAPAQLKQSYVVVPAKQRLVTLAALLRRTFARRGSVMKAIVFLSCADSVDFHFEVFARKNPAVAPETQPAPDPASSRPNPTGSDFESASKKTKSSSPGLPTVSATPLLTTPHNPSLHLHKLHGSLPQPLRTATLSSFSRSADPCILLCTDVASRGLDLPNIDLVIEFDPPFSADDHLHRVGRTARAGKEGRAMIFLMPGGEEGYVEVLKAGYRDGVGRVGRSEATELLRRGFEGTDVGGGGNWEERATEWQLAVERWILDHKRAGEVARKAFVSHVRAYATHVAKERGMFDVKGLHLGHLAKAFALRDRPGNMGRAGGRDSGGSGKTIRRGQGEKRKAGDAGGGGGNPSWRDETEVEATDGRDAARKMRAKMKEHMAVASEFNIG